MINSGFSANEDTNGESVDGVGWTQTTTNNGRIYQNLFNF